MSITAIESSKKPPSRMESISNILECTQKVLEELSDDAFALESSLIGKTPPNPTGEEVAGRGAGRIGDILMILDNNLELIQKIHGAVQRIAKDC